MSEVSLCRRSHYGCALHEWKFYNVNTRLYWQYVHWNTSQTTQWGNKSTMELHSPFREKKAQKGKKIWLMQKTRGKAQDE